MAKDRPNSHIRVNVFVQFKPIKTLCQEHGRVGCNYTVLYCSHPFPLSLFISLAQTSLSGLWRLFLLAQDTSPCDIRGQNRGNRNQSVLEALHHTLILFPWWFGRQSRVMKLPQVWRVLHSKRIKLVCWWRKNHAKLRHVISRKHHYWWDWLYVLLWLLCDTCL